MSEALKLEDLVPNARLGHYTILEHVADGGMGHIYKAFEPSLNREVAVKVLKPELAATGRHVDFFEEEAQNIAALRHPNIVPIYYIGKQGYLRYFVMAFIPGGATLDNWIDTGTPFSVEQAYWVLYQAIDALDAAFQRKIIHLDIKPSNFLVDAKGESILLTDFGLARCLAESAQRNGDSTERESFGTPAYMCPEQIMNQAVDQRSDIYALGATMYHLMTTRMLYERETIEDIIVAHCESPFPYKEAEESALSPGWINLFDRMTQKDPADRFQHYAELREALAHVDQLPPVHVHASEDLSDLTPVPNRGNQDKAFLYGLLSPQSASWTETEVEAPSTRSKAELLNQINHPFKPLAATPYTRALLELQQEVKPDLEDLAAAAEMMPQLSEFFLALANTRFFRKENEAGDLKSAIEILGADLSHHLVLTNFIFQENPLSDQEFNWWPLLQHSLSTALVSVFLLDYLEGKMETNQLTRMLSNFTKAKTHRLAYLGGLVHDIGKIILGETAAYTYYSIMHQAMETHRPIYEVELKVLGVDHQEIGNLWCGKFNFDHAVRDVVANHNQGGRKSPRLRAVVYLANQLVKKQGLGFSGNPIIEVRDLSTTLAWQQLINTEQSGVTPEKFEEEFASLIGELPLLSQPQKAKAAA